MKNKISVSLIFLSQFMFLCGMGQVRPSSNKDFFIPSPEFGNIQLIGMNSEANQLDANHNPTVSPGNNRFYYVPLFAFKKNVDGTFRINKIGSAAVSIPVVYETRNTKAIFANYLVSQHLLTSGVMEGNVQLSDFKHLEVKGIDNSDNSITISFHFPEDYTPANNEVEWDYTFPTTVMADKFIKDFKDGNITFTINMVFEGYSFSENSATITYEDVRNTAIYNNIVGTGGLGQVSRKKIGQLASQAISNRGILIVKEFDDPDFNTLVTSMANLSEIHEVALTDGWKSLQNEFNSLGIDPNDFKADVITSSKYNMTSEQQSTFENDFNDAFGTSGNFSYAGIGAGGSLNNTLAQKAIGSTLNKYGVSYDETGNRILPKQIAIYQLNDSKLRQQGTFIVGSIKKTVADKQMNLVLNVADNSLPYGDAEANFLEGAVPTGAILPFGGPVDKIPKGYVLCDGSTLNRVQYNTLFLAIGISWGEGDGNSTFNIPDLRGSFLRGTNYDRTDERKDPNAGERKLNGAGKSNEVGSFQDDVIKRHKHSIVTNYHSPLDFDLGSQPPRTQDVGSQGHPNAKSEFNDEGGDETRPKNYAVNYIIKCR